MYFTGLYAGYSLALGVGTLVDDILGWHWAYVLAALGGFVLAAVAFATVPEPEPLVRAQRSGSSVGGSRSITRSTRRPSASALDPANGVVGSLQRVTGREERDGSGARVKEVESRDRVKTGEQSPLSSPTSSSPRYDGNSGAGNVINDGVYDGGAIRAAQATPTYRPLSSKPTSPIERRRRSSPLSGRPARDAVMWPPEGRSSLSHTTPPPPPPPQPLLSRPLSQWRDKLPDLSAAWLGSPSLLLVCVAGGVRDAGGFVFGYYLASYFSPLMDRNLALTGHGSDPCSFSFDADFGAEQVLHLPRNVCCVRGDPGSAATSNCATCACIFRVGACLPIWLSLDSVGDHLKRDRALSLRCRNVVIHDSFVNTVGVDSSVL